MGTPFRHGGTATIVRDLGYDTYGDPIGGAPERIEVKGCAWAPRTEQNPSLDQRGRQGVIVGLTLLAPTGAPFRHSDQVELEGVTDVDGAPVPWEIEGDPGQWDNPKTGRRHGLQMALRRAQG